MTKFSVQNLSEQERTVYKIRAKSKVVSGTVASGQLLTSTGVRVDDLEKAQIKSENQKTNLLRRTDALVESQGNCIKTLIWPKTKQLHMF